MNSRSKQFTEQALAHHQAGRLQQALPLYEKAVAVDNNNSDAHQFMGLLFLHAGKPKQGISCIRNAIAINDQVAPYHDNLGAALESIGDYEAALASYESASALERDNADRLFGKANVLAALGKASKSEEQYRKAIALNPDDSAFYFNLGNLLKSEGRFQSACECYQQASIKKPEIEGVWINWGNTLLSLHDYSNAVQLLEKAATQNPNSIDVLTALSTGLMKEGVLEQAGKRIAQVESLLSQSDDRAKVSIWNLKGKLALQTAKFREAISAYRQVRKIEPDNLEAAAGLAATFRWILPTAYEPELVSDLQQLFQHPEIAGQRFSRLAANQIRHRLGFEFAKLERGEDRAKTIAVIASDDFLKTYLSDVTNTDAELEANLTLIRRVFLELAVAQEVVADSVRDLACSLSVQLFINEHVFATDDIEHGLLARLAKNVAPAVACLTAESNSTQEEFV
nr:tetratricopeptide repeat protein [Gammaproteobacteria bacterium]